MLPVAPQAGQQSGSRLRFNLDVASGVFKPLEHRHTPASSLVEVGPKTSFVSLTTTVPATPKVGRGENLNCQERGTKVLV
jgi:hypothetical protein